MKVGPWPGWSQPQRRAIRLGLVLLAARQAGAEDSLESTRRELEEYGRQFPLADDILALADGKTGAAAFERRWTARIRCPAQVLAAGFAIDRDSDRDRSTDAA